MNRATREAIGAAVGFVTFTVLIILSVRLGAWLLGLEFSDLGKTMTLVMALSGGAFGGLAGTFAGGDWR
jgi:hypothetical protein